MVLKFFSERCWDMQPIGIFDSGVGGLGIFKAIAQLLPEQDLIFFADNNNLPFGQKTTAQLQQITSKILDYLILKHNIKIAVVACNTASVSSLSYLREKYPNIPIVGAVPCVKPACQLSKNKKVAILATLHTTNSDYQKQLIAQYGKGIEVLSIACPALVELVEAGRFDDLYTQDKLREYLAPAIELGVDVIGLACTHYPFLRAEIQKLLPDGVVIVDSNEPVARQVVKVYNQMLDNKTHDRQMTMSGIKNQSAKYSFYVTKDPKQFHKITQRLIGDMFSGVNLISL